jgi:hypothetical protein
MNTHTQYRKPDKWKRISSAAFLFLFFAFCFSLFSFGCTSPKSTDNPVAPAATMSLSVEARPQTIAANGTSHLVVFVEMRHGSDPVSDSTEVILLNTIGTLGLGIVYTHAGVALDTLTSDSSAESGWLIAYSNGFRDSVEIAFTTIP